MNRRHVVMFSLIGLVMLVILIFLAWCPPDACRVLHIQTYTISKLDEYSHFLADQIAFNALHHARAVRLNCSALRDDVVASLEAGRLTVGITKQNRAIESGNQHRPIQAWHQGRLLHLLHRTSENHQLLDAWAMRVRAAVAEQQQGELSFLPRLFGGVIIHVHNQQIPIVLFSDQPCV